MSQPTRDVTVRRPVGAPLLRGALSARADRLVQLGEMVRQGLLTPEEFATAKARLLGG
ncbi:SHOCT domain-containing protein [Streptacidiphilus carbonis]|jgi:hypothetical protein|uniref:SHOCT domain-containing protein n=1 Tax=Streptacidiphilus carbonis TaxID=105422 RepID=UPI000AD3CCBF|nr:SHOCT domain-containing protein [Streptacidiphilus carbonis]